VHEWEDLRGRSALVTGSARRVGRAIVLGLAERGANVVVHYRGSQTEAEGTASDARRHGVRAAALAADLEDDGQVRELIARGREAAGPLDILVNSASLFGPQAFSETSRASWDRHMAVNLTAPFRLAQAFAVQGEGGDGVVLNLLDWRAVRPGADHFAYTSSKAALASLTRSLALALAPRIRVNGLALGAILPPEGQPADPLLVGRIPLRRWGTLEEVVHAAMFLLAGSDFVTGSILLLDGGRHLT
jgi:pteridine reductase